MFPMKSKTADVGKENVDIEENAIVELKNQIAHLKLEKAGLVNEKSKLEGIIEDHEAQAQDYLEEIKLQTCRVEEAHEQIDELQSKLTVKTNISTKAHNQWKKEVAKVDQLKLETATKDAHLAGKENDLEQAQKDLSKAASYKPAYENLLIRVEQLRLENERLTNELHSQLRTDPGETFIKHQQEERINRLESENATLTQKNAELSAGQEEFDTKCQTAEGIYAHVYQTLLIEQQNVRKGQHIIEQQKQTISQHEHTIAAREQKIADYEAEAKEYLATTNARIAELEADFDAASHEFIQNWRDYGKSQGLFQQTLSFVEVHAEGITPVPVSVVSPTVTHLDFVQPCVQDIVPVSVIASVTPTLAFSAAVSSPVAVPVTPAVSRFNPFVVSYTPASPCPAPVLPVTPVSPAVPVVPASLLAEKEHEIFGLKDTVKDHVVTIDLLKQSLDRACTCVLGKNCKIFDLEKKVKRFSDHVDFLLRESKRTTAINRYREQRNRRQQAELRGRIEDLINPKPAPLPNPSLFSWTATGLEWNYDGSCREIELPDYRDEPAFPPTPPDSTCGDQFDEEILPDAPQWFDGTEEEEEL